MAIENLPLAQPLGTRRLDILLADLVQEGVLGQQRDVAKADSTMAVSGSARCQK